MFAIWAGTVLDITKKLVLVCDEGKEEESLTRLARVGYENVAGYLTGGFNTWLTSGNKIDLITSIEPDDLVKKVKENAIVLDVRKISEAESGHIAGALVLPLSDLQENIDLVNKEEPVYIHCAGGYRSMIATSILKSKGFTNVINVHQGWSKIKDFDFNISVGVPENIATN